MCLLSTVFGIKWENTLAVIFAKMVIVVNINALQRLNFINLDSWICVAFPSVS